MSASRHKTAMPSHWASVFSLALTLAFVSAQIATFSHNAEFGPVHDHSHHHDHLHDRHLGHDLENKPEDENGSELCEFVLYAERSDASGAVAVLDLRLPHPFDLTHIAAHDSALTSIVTVHKDARAPPSFS